MSVAGILPKNDGQENLKIPLGWAGSFYLSSEVAAGYDLLLTIAGPHYVSVRAGIRHLTFWSDSLCQGQWTNR